ncbi:amino acid ABC transporter permease [Brevibacterium samyangense]|uniref:Amino acid ABC transporter permease n=1 Tax=Brevibacterium samyangense TaxID=366888 RepID=A0ABP5EXE3_9MICO
MSTQAALAHFDVPGPRTVRNIRILTVVGIIGVLALAAFVVYRFWVTDQLDPAKWSPFTYVDIQEALLLGVWSTVQVAAVSAVLTLAIGFTFGILQLSHRKWITIPARFLVEVFRGVPVLLLIFIMFYLGQGTLSSFWSVCLGVAAYNGMVVAEIVRAGILSVPKGQREAGMSIGLGRGQVMREILLPQALRAMAPTLVSQMVVMLKDSALGYMVNYTDLLYVVNNIGRDFNNLLPTFILGAGIYVCLNLCISGIAKLLEKRQSLKVAAK